MIPENLRAICSGERTDLSQEELAAYRTICDQLNKKQTVSRSMQAIRSMSSKGDPPKSRERTLLNAVPCIHRSPESVRSDTSNLCGTRGDSVKIFACAIHGECSLHKYCSQQKVKTCLGCPSAQEFIEPAVQPPKINPKRSAPRPTDPPEPIPVKWGREPVRHMIYHIWPTKRSESWRRNVAELRKRIEIFNGLRIVGIAVDADTVTPDEVKAAFSGCRVDHWVVADNDKKLGEGATFHKMMKLLPRDDDNITWYGHAKGTKYAEGQDGVVPRWTDMLYRTTLDNYSEVKKSLTQFPITGSMKRYGDFNKPNTWRWHYSGTFFWFRNADVFARPQWVRLVPFYGCVECWPSCVFKASEAGFLFGNNVGLLYIEKEIADLEEQLKTWPPDERHTTNGVTDRWFFEEEYRRQISSGKWPELVAIHSSGAEALRKMGAKTVLEIGSGLGAFLHGSREARLITHGIGCSPFERNFAITVGVQPEQYELVSAGDFEPLAKYDAAYCIEVFEHMTDDEICKLMEKLSKCCRLFYFSSTPYPADDDKEWGHINIKSKEQWIELFSRYGFHFKKDDHSVTAWGMVFSK